MRVNEAETLECLLNHYIEYHDIGNHDVLLVKDTRGWTDTSSIISVQQYKGQIDFDEQSNLYGSTFKGIKLLAFIDSIDGTVIRDNGSPRFTVATHLSWDHIDEVASRNDPFSYPESFNEVQVEYANQSYFKTDMLGSQTVFTKPLSCPPAQ